MTNHTKKRKIEIKNIQARLVASSAWQQLVTAVKTLFSVIVIVEIIIIGYIGACSDDDDKDDNHDAVDLTASPARRSSRQLLELLECSWSASNSTKMSGGFFIKNQNLTI